MEKLLAYQEKKTIRETKYLKGMVIAACILVFVMWWKPEIWAKAKNIIWEWLDRVEQDMTGEDNVLLWKDEEENVSFSLFSVLGYEQMQTIRKGITRAESR